MNLKDYLRTEWILFKLKLRLKAAIRLTEYKHFINNRKYWILPEQSTGGIIVANRDELKYYKRKGVFPKHYGNIEFTRMAFYATAEDRSGKQRPSKEELADMRKKYYRYARILKPVSRMAKVGTPTVA